MVFWAIEERGCPCGASWTEADAVFDCEVRKKIRFLAIGWVQAPLAQIPWGPNLRILEAVKYPVDREWYIRYTIEQG